MKVGDLVRWSKHTRVRERGPPNETDLSTVGIVFSIYKDPAWVELQVKVLWPEGFWTQSIKNLEVVSEAR